MKKLLQILLLIVNVVFAVLLLASTLAGTLLPSKCIWFSILSYGYFYLLLANIVFVLLWLFMARKECLLSIITIAIRYSFLPLYFQFGGTTAAELPATESSQLRVLSWNVHAFAGPEDNNKLADTNATLFLDVIREYQPDVLSLQEFYVPNKFHLYDSLTRMGYRHSYGINESSKGVPYGVAIFSKYPLDYVHDIDHSRKFFADVQWNNNIVRVLCCHLTSYQLDSIDRQGLNQAVHGTVDSTTHRTFRKFRGTINAHQEEWTNEIAPIVAAASVPVIMTGDFNDTPASYLYQQAKDLLKDAFVEQGKGMSVTYRGKFPNYRIDYILHSPQLKAVSYDRVKSDVSDHYPIIATFEL